MCTTKKGDCGTDNKDFKLLLIDPRLTCHSIGKIQVLVLVFYIHPSRTLKSDPANFNPLTFFTLSNILVPGQKVRQAILYCRV